MPSSAEHALPGAAAPATGMSADRKSDMSGKASVAVIILTYNESLHLPRALSHVQGFAQEVFVVDSLSTDDTVDIARSYGAQVLQHPFQNQAKQFQWALDHAPITSEWVMRLDAD